MSHPSNSGTSVWYEKYKPKNVNELIVPSNIKERLISFVQNDEIPHIGLFSTEPGTGKSSASHAIITQIGCEALWINASMEKGIDVLRGKIQNFASQASFDGKLKIVVMDEFDNFSQDGQKAFRGFINEFSENCRFIITGNYKEKIIEPLLNRLEVYDFNAFDRKEMLKPIFERLQEILDNEGVSYEKRDLVPVINSFYPSIRAMIGALQRFSGSGTLVVPENALNASHSFAGILDLCSPGTYLEMVQAINELPSPDSMYTYIYQNAQNHFAPAKYPNVIIAVAKYQHMSSAVRDKHLNLAACCTELMQFKA